MSRHGYRRNKDDPGRPRRHEPEDHSYPPAYDTHGDDDYGAGPGYDPERDGGFAGDRVRGNYWGNDLDRYERNRLRRQSRNAPPYGYGRGGTSAPGSGQRYGYGAGGRRTYDSPADAQDGYRGLGPRNYSRSDDRIRDDVCDALCDDPEVDATDIDVKVAGGEVVLDGSVANRAQRRFAEDCVENVAGIGHIQNNLRVKSRQCTTGLDPGTVSGMFGSSAGRNKTE